MTVRKTWGFGFESLHFLSGLMTTAAMPAVIKLSKSIPIFGGGTVWGPCGDSELATVFSFRLAIDSTVQFVEQCLRLFQVCGVEALGEPPVDFREHRARLIATIRIALQPREAHRRA